ncbi:MAG: TolC family protein [Flavobacteriales bacterium]
MRALHHIHLRSRIAVLALLCLPAFVTAQVLPLDSVLNAIATAHPDLKAYDARIKAYDAYATGARALDPPKIGGGFFMTPYNTMYWKGDGMGDPGMGMFMLSAEQMFMNRGKRNANYDYMRGMSMVDAQMKTAMRNELFSMAKMNYYDLLVLKKKERILMESEALLDYIIRSTEIRYTYGMDKLNAYYKAKAMLGDVQNMLVMNAQEMAQMRVALNTLMARDKDAMFDIDTAYTVRPYETAPIDTATIAASRSDFRAIDANIALLRSKQDLQRASLRPDYGIKYDHMLPFGTDPNQFSLMGMLTIPIAPWSSKMYRSTITGLDFEAEALEEQKNALINQAAGTLNILRERIRSKQQQLDLYDKTIVPAMRLNYQATLLAYEQNTDELFMVLDAWQNLKVAQLARLDLLMELLKNTVEYEQQLEIR